MKRALIVLFLVVLAMPLHAQDFEPEYANVIQLRDGGVSASGYCLVLQYHNSDLKIIVRVDRRTHEATEIGDTWVYNGEVWRPE